MDFDFKCLTGKKLKVMCAEKSRKIIYLADDDEDDRQLFLDAVEELGAAVSVEAAADGKELLNNLNKPMKTLPEMIFLDINMPGKNGFECLKEIRSEEKAFKDVKIIMFSTSSSMSNIELSYNLGADLYAVKPSTFQGLKNLLSEIMDADWNLLIKNKKSFLLT